jgi:threonine dehydratase
LAPDAGRAAEVAFADVRDAAARLKGVALRTPVLTSRTFDERVGASVRFKCENFQRAGAFKFRGAYNTVSRLDGEQRRRGVASFSSGNHAQGLALAARLVGAPAVIVMPSDAPPVKLEATRGYGAEIILYRREEEDREAIARRLAGERGLAVVPPFDHPHIIAGQGTAALELLEEVPDLDILVAPVGGGGLIAGSCLAAHGLRPGIRVVGVEPEAANDAFLSLQRGERVRTPQARSVADGLLPTCPGVLTFAVMREHVEAIALVSDAEILAAMRFLLERMKILVEPSGAAPAAALLEGRVPGIAGRRVGVILSGGNVEPAALGAPQSRQGAPGDATA